MNESNALTIELPVKITPTIENDGYVITDSNEVERFFYEKEKGSTEMIYDGVSFPVIKSEDLKKGKKQKTKIAPTITISHKLTNLDISKQYKDLIIYAMKHEFIGAFACWVIRQNEEGQDLNLCFKAVEAYSKWLKAKFPSSGTIKKLNTKQVQNLTSVKVFESIPEILALNQIEGNGMVALGALSNNVYFQILREHITQPLD